MERRDPSARTACCPLDKVYPMLTEEVFAAEECDCGGEGGGPFLPCGLGIGAEGFDVEAEGVAFLRAVEIDERGAQDAVERGGGVVERGGVAGEAAEELLLLGERGEEVTLTPDEVDVAGEAGGGGGGVDVEIEAEVFELVGG